MKRDSLNQDDKYRGFRRAFDVYGQHLAAGNYIGAFVVAFSLFEDRVTASFMLAKDLAKEPRPEKFQQLASKIKFLERTGHLPTHTRNDWLKAARNRNEKIHAAMWNVDEFSESDASAAVARAREADKLSKKLKQRVAAA